MDLRKKSDVALSYADAILNVLTNFDGNESLLVVGVMGYVEDMHRMIIELEVERDAVCHAAHIVNSIHNGAVQGLKAEK